MTDKKTDAWMPLWIGAYLADTQHLTTQEHGAYFLLMMAYWRNKGPLQDDDKRLASIVKASPRDWKSLRSVLAEFFSVADGVWRQKRIDAELYGAGNNKETAEKKAAVRWESDPENKGRHLRSQRISEARQKGTHTPMQWEVMKNIHGHACVRCGASDAELVKDHIQPIYQGGSDGVENIQPLCRKCNSSKGPEAKDYRIEGWFDALAEGIKCLQNACPTPSPTPYGIGKPAFVAKDLCVGILPHTQFLEEFRAAAKARPDIDAEAVWAKFNDHYPPQSRTLARWKTWLSNEQAPKHASAAASVSDPDSRASIEALAASKGMPPWDGYSCQWEAYKARVRGQEVAA